MKCGCNFETSWAATPSRHMDDTTRAVWRPIHVATVGVYPVEFVKFHNGYVDQKMSPLSLSPPLTPFFLSSLRETEVSECVGDHPATTCDCGSKREGLSEYRGPEGGPSADCVVPQRHPYL